jgi:hypothetical protein
MNFLIGDLAALPKIPLNIAINECLVGVEVRHDGGHKRSSLPHDKLEGLFRFRPVCPEVGIGLGVPRDAIRLVGDIDSPRAVNVKHSAIDLTAMLTEFTSMQVPALEDVDGQVFTNPPQLWTIPGQGVWQEGCTAKSPRQRPLRGRDRAQAPGSTDGRERSIA